MNSPILMEKVLHSYSINLAASRCHQRETSGRTITIWTYKASKKKTHVLTLRISIVIWEAQDTSRAKNNSSDTRSQATTNTQPTIPQRWWIALCMGQSCTTSSCNKWNKVINLKPIFCSTSVHLKKLWWHRRVSNSWRCVRTTSCLIQPSVDRLGKQRTQSLTTSSLENDIPSKERL